MAASPASQQATRNRAIVALAARQLAALWPRVDWTSDRAVDAVTTVYRAIVTRYGQSAAAVAAEFYDDTRAAHRLPSRYRARPADPVPDEQITRKVESAFRGKVTVTVLDQPAVSSTTSDLPVDQRVQQRLEQSLSRLVLQPGRDTIAENTAKDPAGTRYIRVPNGETTCEFCIMLASREITRQFRGYRTKATALLKNGEKYHNGCDCEAVPVFPGDDIDELSPNLRDYQDLYYRATDAAGTSSDTKAILAKMRQLIKDQQPQPKPEPPQPEPRPRPIDLDTPAPRRDPGPVAAADTPRPADDPLPTVKAKPDPTERDLADDLLVTNPNYFADEKWQINCTRCATTVELRARGYDVTAEPKPVEVTDNDYASILQRWTSPDGTPAGTGAGEFATRSLDDAAAADEALGMSAGSRVWDWLPAGKAEAKQAADAAVTQWGDGARGYITVVWENRRSAHIFNVENRGGTVIYTDGQSNKIDARGHWDGISDDPQSSRIVRTDDLTPTTRVLEWVRERTDTDYELARKKAAAQARYNRLFRPSEQPTSTKRSRAGPGSADAPTGPGGSVDRSHVPRGLRQHELDTAERLAQRGHQVVFLAAAGTEKSPDATVDGEVWEFKAVFGSSPDAVARHLRAAAKQARRTRSAVLDVTGTDLTDDDVKRLVAHYGRRYNLRAVRVIRGGSDGMDWRWSSDEA